MKKLRLILVVFGLLLTIISSGQTLTFRLANPGLVYEDNGAGMVNYFAFDVQVKADAAGSYLWSGQAVLSFDNTSLSAVADEWMVEFGPILQGTYSGSTPKYQSLQTITGSKFNFGFYGNPGNITQTTFTRFNTITTSFNTIARIKAPITNVAGMAGVDFIELDMNGYQSKKLTADPWYTGYTNPSLYDPANFMDTYLGRIFANATWTQFGGSVDWSAAVNTSVWDGTAVIPGGSVSNAAALRIYDPAVLTIPVTGKLTVDGNSDILTAAGLVVQSSAGGTGSFISNTVTGAGTAMVQRYMVGGAPTAWHMISSPVGGQSISLFVNDGGNHMAFNGPKFGLAPYDNSIPNWVPFTAGTLAGNFVDGKGYEILTTQDGPVTFTGTVSTGVVGIGITNPGTDKWWNLVGNPYPSAINANVNAGATNFLTTNAGILNAAKTAVYVYNQGTSTYDVYNQASPAAYVPVGQAFFVKAATGGGTVNYTAGMRTHTSGTFKSVQSTNPSINVMANIAGQSRNAQIYFIAGTTTGVDQGYDAGIWEENNPEVALYTAIEGSDVGFAIQSLPDTDYEGMVIPVGLNAPQGSVINFTAEVENLPVGTRVYLEDKLTGKFTRLDESGSFYLVDTKSPSNGTGRFFIHTTQGSLGVNSELLSDLTVIPMPREHKIRVLGTVTPNSMATIYEMNGAVVGTQVLPNVGENEMPFMPVANGIYMLKVQQTGKTPTSVKINWIY